MENARSRRFWGFALEFILREAGTNGEGPAMLLQRLRPARGDEGGNSLIGGFTGIYNCGSSTKGLSGSTNAEVPCLRTL